MNLEEILDKKFHTMKDMKVVMLFEMIDRLHKKDIPENDIDEIKKTISKIWRKHHPISEISSYLNGGKNNV